jgi:hypothetical protein
MMMMFEIDQAIQQQFYLFSIVKSKENLFL